MSTPLFSPAPVEGLPKPWQRALLCLAALTVALLACCPSPQACFLVPSFPLGFFRLFIGGSDVSHDLAVPGWIGYLLAAAVPILARRRVVFRVGLAVLAFLLCSNVVGCHLMWRDAAHGH